jgi:hypothetical protein
MDKVIPRLMEICQKRPRSTSITVSRIDYAKAWAEIGASVILKSPYPIHGRSIDKILWQSLRAQMKMVPIQICGVRILREGDV